MSKILAIIPARGGSKRLANKNILELSGEPLIVHTIKAAISSALISQTIVSSDSKDILNIAKKYEVQAISRPLQLALDTSSTFETLEHVILNQKERYDYIVLLQPTSPLRNTKHIDEAIKLLKEKKADAIVSVCECEHSPLWTNTIEDTLALNSFIDETIKKTRSQDLKKFYRLNGAIYICRTDLLLKNKSFFLKENIFAYIMPQEVSIDIDTPLDFLIAQTILKEKKDSTN